MTESSAPPIGSRSQSRPVLRLAVESRVRERQTRIVTTPTPTVGTSPVIGFGLFGDKYTDTDTDTSDGWMA